MSYDIKISTQHIAQVTCRLIETTNAIGFIAAKNAVADAAEVAASTYGADVACKYSQGGYTVIFSKENESEPVRASAEALVDWLHKDKRYIPQQSRGQR